jgi:hypothetical protein
MRSRQQRSVVERPTRSRSSRVTAGLSGLVIVLAAVGLETLPVTAWLETAAGLVTGNPGAEAAPFWLVYGSVLAAAGIGTCYQRRLIPFALAVALVVAAWVGTLLVMLRVSPGAYAGVAPTAPLSLGWLAQVAANIVTGSGRIAVDLGLVALAAYLWWRGLRVGREGATYDQLYLTFRIGLAGIIGATVVGVAGAARATLGGRLALLLPLEVGVGLVGLTLTHISRYTSQSRRAGAADEGDFGQAQWLLSAFGLAVLVVGGALLLALVFSYDTLLALAQALRPIGDALGAALVWLIEAVALVLFFLLNGPIQWLEAHAKKQSSQVQPPPLSTVHIDLKHPAQGIPHDWLVAGRIAVIALAMLIILAILVQLLRRARMLAQREEFDETREALNARSLLNDQLGALFSRMLPRRSSVADEDLPSGSVRCHYREVLRAALRAGRGRGAAETPDEYQRRLATVASDASGPGGGNGGAPPVGDLAGLTRRYDQARYGEVPDQRLDREAAQAESRRLVEWFARHRRRARDSAAS